jgi:hypothetical protein
MPGQEAVAPSAIVYWTALTLRFRIGVCETLFIFNRLFGVGEYPIRDDNTMISTAVSRMEEHRIRTNSPHTTRRFRHPVPKIQERFAPETQMDSATASYTVNPASILGGAFPWPRIRAISETAFIFLGQKMAKRSHSFRS